MLHIMYVLLEFSRMLQFIYVWFDISRMLYIIFDINRMLYAILV